MNISGNFDLFDPDIFRLPADSNSCLATDQFELSGTKPASTDKTSSVASRSIVEGSLNPASTSNALVILFPTEEAREATAQRKRLPTDEDEFRNNQVSPLESPDPSSGEDPSYRQIQEYRELMASGQVEEANTQRRRIRNRESARGSRARKDQKINRLEKLEQELEAVRQKHEVLKREAARVAEFILARVTDPTVVAHTVILARMVQD
jgi:hypothetical protein